MLSLGWDLFLWHNFFFRFSLGWSNTIACVAISLYISYEFSIGGLSATILLSQNFLDSCSFLWSGCASFSLFPSQVIRQFRICWVFPVFLNILFHRIINLFLVCISLSFNLWRSRTWYLFYRLWHALLNFFESVVDLFFELVHYFLLELVNALLRRGLSRIHYNYK